jgi:hypothetical protein
MVKEFKEEMKLSEYSWYLCLGFIEFIVGWLDFLYVVLSRRYSKLVHGNNHSR